MGQNLPLCAQLGAARFRQDESKQEARGRCVKWGRNGRLFGVQYGVHVIWWIGLFFLVVGLRQNP
jgi:hypothetical protein